ncbi:MAG TPA: hypothetical protein VLB84_10735 [Bacteroidia bacterium]|jgi:hypothetical protein|nr:hypothetical protein [Bacteroidia bacterium]
MKRNKQLLIILLCMLFLYSCKNELAPAAFFKKIAEDKEYKKEQTIGDFMLNCTYRPSELICLKEMEKRVGNINNISSEEFEKELKQYKNGCYMDVAVWLNKGGNVMMQGIGNQSEYAARLGELTYLLTNSCYLYIDKKDTIKAMDCLFSNAYGNSPVTRFMIVFPMKSVMAAKESVVLEYRDRTFGIPGTAEFNYDPETLQKKLPKLKEQKN